MQRPLFEMNATIPSAAVDATAATGTGPAFINRADGALAPHDDDDLYSNYRLDSDDYYQDPPRVVPIVGILKQDEGKNHDNANDDGCYAENQQLRRDRREMRPVITRRKVLSNMPSLPANGTGHNSGGMKSRGAQRKVHHAASRDKAIIGEANNAVRCGDNVSDFDIVGGEFTCAITGPATGMLRPSSGASLGALSALTNFSLGDNSMHVGMPGPAAATAAATANANFPPLQHAGNRSHAHHHCGRRAPPALRSNSMDTVSSVHSIFSAFSAGGDHAAAAIVVDQRRGGGPQARRRGSASGGGGAGGGSGGGSVSGLRRTNSAANLRDFTDTIMSLKLQLAELHSELDAVRQSWRDAAATNVALGRRVEALAAEREDALDAARTGEVRVERAERKMRAAEQARAEERTAREKMERRLRRLEEERDAGACKKERCVGDGRAARLGRMRRQRQPPSGESGNNERAPTRRGLFSFDGNNRSGNGGSGRRSSSGRKIRGGGLRRDKDALYAPGAEISQAAATNPPSAFSKGGSWEEQSDSKEEEEELLEGFGRGHSPQDDSTVGTGDTSAEKKLTCAAGSDRKPPEEEQRVNTEKHDQGAERRAGETDSCVGWYDGWNDDEGNDEGENERVKEEGTKQSRQRDTPHGGREGCNDGNDNERNGNRGREEEENGILSNAHADDETYNNTATERATTARGTENDEEGGNELRERKKETDSVVGWYNGWDDDEGNDEGEEEGMSQSRQRDTPHGGREGCKGGSDEERNANRGREEIEKGVLSKAHANGENDKNAATERATTDRGTETDEEGGNDLRERKKETDSVVGWYNGWDDDSDLDDNRKEEKEEGQSNAEANKKCAPPPVRLETGRRASAPSAPAAAGGDAGDDAAKGGKGGSSKVLRGIVNQTCRMGRRASLNLVQPILAASAGHERFLSGNGRRVPSNRDRLVGDGPDAVEDLLWDQSVMNFDVHVRAEDTEENEDYRAYEYGSYEAEEEATMGVASPRNHCERPTSTQFPEPPCALLGRHHSSHEEPPPTTSSNHQGGPTAANGMRRSSINFL